MLCCQLKPLQARAKKTVSCRIHIVLLIALSMLAAACSSQGPLPSPKPNITPPPSVVKTTIGVSLPLTGDNALTGQAMLNGVELALFDAQNPLIALNLHDSNKPENFSANDIENITKSSAKIIIGQVGSKAIAMGSEALAGSPDIRRLAFSDDEMVVGTGIYLMNVTIRQQVNDIIAYAYKIGARQFGAFIPDDNYGQIIRTAFLEAVQQQSGVIVNIITYPPQNPSLTPELADMVRLGNNGFPPVDALFIPEGGASLHYIASLLNNAGYIPSTIRLLGSSEWADSDLSNEPLLNGGLYPRRDPGQFDIFAKHYQEVYGEPPPMIVSNAYDATNLAISLIDKMNKNSNIDNLLTAKAGFAGIGGKYYFTINGIAHYQLSIVEVSPNGVIVLDGAN